MGRKQKKTISLDWATKEPSVASNYSIPARNLRKTDLGAVIFGTTHNTINECLSHQLFGLPEGHYSYIKNIKQGLVLFLFNYSDRKLHGIFEAASPGQLNIDPYAWVTDRDDTGYTRYPAQVKVRVRTLCHPLSENQFGTIIARNYYEGVHFHFELDQDQTNRLVSLFMSSPMNSNISTKWNNLYASLPASTERQGYNAPVSTGMTNLSEPEVGGHALPGNLNQTSKISYASALGRNGTTSNIGCNSQPVGKWSALFKSESGSEKVNDDKYGKESAPVQTWGTGSSSLANTTKDNLPMNQEYEDDADFWQADTWEESHWVSDSDPQANAAADGNTWDENQNIVTTRCEVKQGHTSGYSGQADTWEENNWLSDADPQANTAADGNAWDENQHIVTTKCEVEQNQTSGYGCQADTWEESHWRSESDPQANTVADGNTWDENPHIVTTRCEVERGQTSGYSGQHLDEPSSPPLPVNTNPPFNLSMSVEKISSDIGDDLRPLVAKLLQEFEEMKQYQLEHDKKIKKLEQETQQLRGRVQLLETGSLSSVDPEEVDNQLPVQPKLADPVLIVGGHDGSTWLPSLDFYFPSRDFKISLSPMNCIRRYASAATLNGEVYHFGGDGLHTVESYNVENNQWIPRPSLFWKNINVAGASVKDRLFVVGGASGIHCSSEVEYLDLNVGKWLPARSMQNKRLAPAAAELNNVLYTSGGYDGESYLSSVERYDPREEVWYKIPSMNARKGCHSMVVLNQKLYTVGGFSGNKYLSTVEYLDPRMGGWVEAEPMNISRGNSGVLVLGGNMYAVGGRQENDKVSNIVECYTEGGCWEVTENMKAIGKRSHFFPFAI